jgi:hypothetical protein
MSAPRAPFRADHVGSFLCAASDRAINEIVQFQRSVVAAKHRRR